MSLDFKILSAIVDICPSNWFACFHDSTSFFISSDWLNDNIKLLYSFSINNRSFGVFADSSIQIGRPKVMDRKGFRGRFGAVLDRLEHGQVSRNQAARELNIGYATLIRLIEASEKEESSE